MYMHEDEALDSPISTKVDVSPIPHFSRPVITTSYATREEWANAALAAMRQMDSDEAFRKDIAQFLS